MLLRMSTLFLHTLREDPADAEVPSHRLLVRAGFVRRAAPGIFTWLPLGYLVLRNIERIVREEMNRIGAQEVHFPALLPREPYEATGRWADYGENLFRLQDRRKVDYLLGPTHEEMFTLLVKGECSSYKDLPLSLFQIQNKYRDEARPRAGILRGREFLMKDSYSFDVDDAGLARSYAAHRDAYTAIFDRLRLDYTIVSAVSGAMGGSASEEFLAECDNGEDTFVRCRSCGYAANVEAVDVAAGMVEASTSEAARPLESLPAARVESTPGTETIAGLVDFANSTPQLRHRDRDWAAADTLKNVVIALEQPDGTIDVLVIGVPGDREVDFRRLAATVDPALARPFEQADFEAHPDLVRGYIGPGALGVARGLRYLVDPRVTAGTSWITGANESGRHVFGLVAGRDFEADGFIDVAEVRDGDPCPNCGAGLELARGIEIGHIFQLGRKYAQALDLKVLDASGKQVVVTMGSYGVGVSRAVAVIAEQSHDERGLIWPREVAPADIHIVIAGKGAELLAAAEELSGQLVAAGVRVLLDDRRQASVGIKFKDAELLGVPTLLIVGKGLADGLVELRDRRTGERRDVAVGEAAAAVLEVVRGDATP